MSIIKSTIKTNPLGKWYIQLEDENENEKKVICLDINDYSQKIEEMGSKYAETLQIQWSSDENVSQIQINEVRGEMMKYEESIKDRVE